MIQQKQQTFRRFALASLAAALLPTLAGCGGGSSPDSSPNVVYDIAELRPLAGDYFSGPSDMNAAGDVVGTSTGDEGPRATLWRAGQPAQPIFLGTLGTGDNSAATGINAAGVVAGHSATNGPANTLGFRWANGTLTALPGPGDIAQALPQAIGSDGRIVGTLLKEGESVPRGVVWSPDGGLTEIPTLPGSAFALPQAIDGAGRVIGQTQTGPGVNSVHRAFVFENGQIRALPPVVDGGLSSARSAGGNGWVVGWSQAPGAARIRATVWRGDAPADLGTLPGHTESAAYGANGAGAIVGFSGNDATTRRAFLWKDGAMADLNQRIPSGTGWTLQIATAINDRGQVTGYGLLGGQSRAFLLTPRP